MENKIDLIERLLEDKKITFREALLLIGEEGVKDITPIHPNGVLPGIMYPTYPPQFHQHPPYSGDHFIQKSVVSESIQRPLSREIREGVYPEKPKS